MLSSITPSKPSTDSPMSAGCSVTSLEKADTLSGAHRQLMLTCNRGRDRARVSEPCTFDFDSVIDSSARPRKGQEISSCKVSHKNFIVCVSSPGLFSCESYKLKTGSKIRTLRNSDNSSGKCLTLNECSVLDKRESFYWMMCCFSFRTVLNQARKVEYFQSLTFSNGWPDSLTSSSVTEHTVHNLKNGLMWKRL